MSALVISTQQCTRYAIRDQKKKVVYILEEVKMSLFTDNMILYVANPKQSRYTHIPGLMFNKVLVYKINTNPFSFCILIITQK